ncbi:hypothetical protein AA106555_0684 [Neokomagataea thailandica NBRC 106555]|uniref:Uncharacterized protein n=2 Tax=Neokomagataea TaxID=1223423 RepID=A0A4Y6V598_9PROT|nr:MULTISPECIES: hypothetical protein [Neokomagataea]QDH24524.1 hypothetical protein D5366_03915 [Neokomagataea tanensis]GBR51782.1 hypothetical protein AA106555_0684 [Neokomagataea thailandica NBRC 106555]
MHALFNMVCTVILAIIGVIVAVIAVIETSLRSILVHFGINPILQNIFLWGVFFFLLYSVFRIFGRLLAFLLLAVLVLYVLQDFSLLPSVHHAAMATREHLETL